MLGAAVLPCVTTLRAFVFRSGRRLCGGRRGLAAFGGEDRGVGRQHVRFAGGPPVRLNGAGGFGLVTDSAEIRGVKRRFNESVFCYCWCLQ